MVRSKLTAYIGFAARARKLKSGDFTCEKLMKQKKVQLMLLDSGVSANTTRRRNKQTKRGGKNGKSKGNGFCQGA